MNLQDAFNDYLLHIAHEKGMSRTSQTTYGTNLRLLLRWLKEEAGDADLSLDAVNSTTLRCFNSHRQRLRLRRPASFGSLEPARSRPRRSG